MKTALRLPRAWRRRLRSLEVFVCCPIEDGHGIRGGDWAYLLANERRSWWAV